MLKIKQDLFWLTLLWAQIWIGQSPEIPSNLSCLVVLCFTLLIERTVPRGHRLNLWGFQKMNICSVLSAHAEVWSCWGLHEWAVNHAVESLHWGSGPCATETFSFFRGSREAGQGDHFFPCPTAMENRDSPKWFLDVDAPLLPLLRLQDYFIHLCRELLFLH